MSGAECPPCALEIREEGTGLKLKTKTSIKPHKTLSLGKEAHMSECIMCATSHTGCEIASRKGLKRSNFTQAGFRCGPDLTLGWERMRTALGVLSRHAVPEATEQSAFKLDMQRGHNPQTTHIQAETRLLDEEHQHFIPQQHLSFKDTKLCCKTHQVAREVTQELTTTKIGDTGKPGGTAHSVQGMPLILLFQTPPLLSFH